MINPVYMSSDHSAIHAGSLLVPVTFGVLIKSREHDGEDFGSIVTDQTHDIFIVPVIQCPLSNLKHKGQI